MYPPPRQSKSVAIFSIFNCFIELRKYNIRIQFVFPGKYRAELQYSVLLQ